MISFVFFHGIEVALIAVLHRQNFVFGSRHLHDLRVLVHLDLDDHQRVHDHDHDPTTSTTTMMMSNFGGRGEFVQNT